MPKHPLCSEECGDARDGYHKRLPSGALLVMCRRDNMRARAGVELCPHHDAIMAEARRRGMVTREEVAAEVEAMDAERDWGVAYHQALHDVLAMLRGGDNA